MALKDVIGQERAVAILQKSIRRGRIPSSYLFIGESGIGKKFTAVNLAKAVNCLKPVPSSKFRVPGDVQNPELRTLNSEPEAGFDSCDECPSCRKISAGIHPDFLSVSPESGQIRIEEIRAIDDVLALKAFEGKKKIVIVDDADAMNLFAANAFLKTLEEPPPDSLIILVSSRPDLLPDTIRSRCSPIRFTPLSDRACEEVLRKTLPQRPATREKKSRRPARSEEITQLPSAPDDRLIAALVKLSMGRPGNVLAGNMLEERIWFLQLLKDMLAAAKDGWASKEEMERWFDHALVFLRDAAVSRVTVDSAVLINSDMKDDIAALSKRTDLRGIINLYGTLSSLRGYFRFHINKALTWNYTGSLFRKTFGVCNA
ncbi:MAG: AAA family ATPase [Nitrospirota bacterium]